MSHEAGPHFAAPNDSLSPFALHHSGGASDGLPPPCLLLPGGSAVGQAACMPGGGLQGPQAGAEGTARLCHRWAGKLLCQWQLRVAYQRCNDGIFTTKQVSCSQQTVGLLHSYFQPFSMSSSSQQQSPHCLKFHLHGHRVHL